MPDQVGHDDSMKSYLKFLSRNKLYTAIEFIGLAGIETLRRSKESYKPAYLLKKYTARWIGA